MPEGDTIARTATTLAVLVGLPIEDVSLPRAPTARVPRPGETITRVEARGKHLLIAFSNGQVLHTHLRMHGSWHLYRRGERWRRPRPTARAVIVTPTFVAVCFAAPVVELLAERELDRHPALATLGPDLCRPDPDVDEVLRRLASIDPHREIGDVLLDQRVAAGIGNVYKSEVLNACRVDPFAPLGSIDEATRRHLYVTAADLLRRNLDGGRRRTVPAGLAVYGRAGRPCRTCGATILTRRQGPDARVTTWCPVCQPASAGAADEPAWETPR